MDYFRIIDKYYGEHPKARRILVRHSEAVFEKCKEIVSACPDINIDMAFVEEATMIHDMGMIRTHAPDLGCEGRLPYICHGYLGREMIENEGFPLHALVCERHSGTGISREEIIRAGLPLPHREMMPLSAEEKLICLADKFFSKSKDLSREISIETIELKLQKYGKTKVQEFHDLMKAFCVKESS